MSNIWDRERLLRSTILAGFAAAGLAMSPAYAQDAEDEEEYLEFHISRSPVTSETILVISDFCDEDEVDDQTQYWDNLMDKLRKATGG